MTIEAKNITKTYGAFRALKDVSVTVPSGKLVALLGPSGSGKTTLLRIIAGLDQGDTGQVLLDGADATELSARDRRVGFVFQHYALFRHMTVFDNIAFGLQVKPRSIRPSKAEIRTRVQELLNMIQLDWLSNRYPSQLSGGQRQRVALARALAVEPRVLLLDEPFGALDAKVRKELRRWLRRLHDEIHVTSVFVTHDVDEALEVADEVVVMNEGRIEQIGTPNEVYERPVNTFVYQFLGSVNLFRTRMLNGRLHLGERALDTPAEAGGEAVVHARPHDIEIERGAAGGGLRATVVRLHAVGPVIRVELRCEGEPNPVEAELSRERFAELALAEGETVCIHPRRMRIFPAAAGGNGAD